MSCAIELIVLDDCSIDDAIRRRDDRTVSRSRTVPHKNAQDRDQIQAPADYIDRLEKHLKDVYSQFPNSIFLIQGDFNLSCTRSRASGRPRPQGGPVLNSGIYLIFCINCLMQSDCLYLLYIVSIQYSFQKWSIKKLFSYKQICYI